MDHAGHHGADDRRDPEQPELLERPAADEQRRTGAARRVHRRVGHRNADQVDQRERETDREAGEARRALARCVAPRMTIRNMNVMTTSVTKRCG